MHNIKAGIPYPATLITTADHDDRVVPAHSFKLIPIPDTGRVIQLRILKRWLISILLSYLTWVLHQNFSTVNCLINFYKLNLIKINYAYKSL